MRLFYDSVTASDIPVAINGIPVDGVLGYADGRYAWSAADWDRFHPETRRVRIAVFPSTVADVLDVESGNPSTDDDAVSWALMCRVHGVARPTVYCSASRVPSIASAATARGVDLDFDVADWTGRPHVASAPAPHRCPITQYASPETGSGGHYDLCLVSDDSWFPAASPSPVPSPVPSPIVNPVQEAVNMFPILALGGTGFTPEAVKVAQGLLNAYGYGLVQDGVYGPKTEAATFGFQHSNGLTVDGRFGPETCARALRV